MINTLIDEDRGLFISFNTIIEMSVFIIVIIIFCFLMACLAIFVDYLGKEENCSTYTCLGRLMIKIGAIEVVLVVILVVVCLIIGSGVITIR